MNGRNYFKIVPRKKPSGGIKNFNISQKRNRDENEKV